jgi:hypothetical protein
MVDEAKAFCPGCGHAFVEEEKRQKKSEFEKQDSTVQLGKTMYNQMLADMGLNLSKPQTGAEKRVEVIAPVGEAAVINKAEQPPAADRAAKPAPEPVPVDKPKKAGRGKWIVLGVIGFLVLLPPALASTVALGYEIWMRLK